MLAIYSPSYKCRRKVEWSIESKRGTKVCPYVKNISVCKQEKKTKTKKNRERHLKDAGAGSRTIQQKHKLGGWPDTRPEGVAYWRCFD